MSRYQKGKTNLDFTEARYSEWQWHQLGRMQVCTSLQTDNHASTPPLSFLQAGCPSCHPTNSVKALKAVHNNLAQLGLESEASMDVVQGRVYSYKTVDLSDINAMMNGEDVSEYLKLSSDGLEVGSFTARIGDIRALTPDEASTRFCDPRGMQG